ncbi:formate--tetrahydrofolate ligase [Microbacterium amylolyticum]|uniref:Formyltetrahydrofolate synthetase n=1 Tax=Microbacterium amylolyticum TaxID=936337 RepID=A0ABS4ZHD6_9MICO|nr:formyltetrahydrofolate synthetase [Microbacterium amylolyticum]
MRETGFDITAASEVMAALSLATSLQDLRARMGRIVIGWNRSGDPVTAEDIRGAGAMTVLLKQALRPNLLQTIEHTPAFVHCGPFGNIATGNSSVVADLIGSRAGEFLVTEAGFAADMGAERFFNIKCRVSGMAPDAAVIVTTVRSMKAHSGRHRIVAGKPLPEELLAENPGAAELARLVEEATSEPTSFGFLYPDEATLVEKVEAIATEVYGADGVDISPQAAKDLAAFEAQGFGHLPVCIAKTHLSLSSDPKRSGAPTGWRLPVREVRLSAGAGFVYMICGDMRTMPGLGSAPAAEQIDIDENGDTVGLF